MGAKIARIGTLVSFLSCVFFSYCHGVAYKPIISIDQILRDIESFETSSESLYWDAEKKVDGYSEFERELLNLGIVVDEAQGDLAKPKFKALEVSGDSKANKDEDETSKESPCMDIVPYVDAIKKEWELASRNARDCRRRIKQNVNAKLPSPYSSCRLFYTHREAYNTLRDTYLDSLRQQGMDTADASQFNQVSTPLVQFIRNWAARNKEQPKAIEYNIEKTDVNKDALAVVPVPNKEIVQKEPLPLVAVTQTYQRKRPSENPQDATGTEMSPSKRSKLDNYPYYTPRVVSVHFGCGGSGGGGDDDGDDDGDDNRRSSGKGNEKSENNDKSLEYYLQNYRFINYKPELSGFQTLSIYSTGIAVLTLSLLM